MVSLTCVLTIIHVYFWLFMLFWLSRSAYNMVIVTSIMKWVYNFKWVRCMHTTGQFHMRFCVWLIYEFNCDFSFWVYVWWSYKSLLFAFTPSVRSGYLCLPFTLKLCKCVQQVKLIIYWFMKDKIETETIRLNSFFAFKFVWLFLNLTLRF